MTRVFLPQSHHQGGSLPHLKPGAAIHLQLDQCEGIHPLQGIFAYLTSTLANKPIFKGVPVFSLFLMRDIPESRQ